MKVIKLIFTLFLILTLSGCSSLTQYRESEQTVLVSALGFDKENNIFLISAETVTKAENGSPQIIISSGKTAEESINNLKNDAGNTLLFSHCATLAIGETVSASDMQEIFLYLSSFYEFPLSCYAVGSENALSLLKSKGIGGGETGYAIMRLLKEKDTDSRLFVLLRKGQLSLPIFSVRNENFVYEDSLWIKE